MSLKPAMSALDGLLLPPPMPNASLMRCVAMTAFAAALKRFFAWNCFSSFKFDWRDVPLMFSPSWMIQGCWSTSLAAPRASGSTVSSALMKSLAS